MRRIKKVAIVGGGVMGADLAATILQSGKVSDGVVVKELNQELADKVRETLDERIDGWARAGYVSDPAAMKAQLSTTASYDDLLDVDLVIEAVTENIELKRMLFAELEEALEDDVYIVSNTSAIPIGLLSKDMEHPERFAGMHFFNPPTKMPLVELIISDKTSEETLSALKKFVSRKLQNKVSIVVKDRPGFLVNVLLAGYLGPAIRSLEETTITLKEIDEKAVGFGWPMGPFALLDRLGIYVACEVMHTMHEAYPDRFSTSDLLDKMVESGRLGRNQGAGFHEYDGREETLDVLRNALFPDRVDGDADKIFAEMMHTMANEAAVAVEDEVSSRSDIESGVLWGLGFPSDEEGILHWADAEGLSSIVDSLGEGATNLLRQMAEDDEEFFEDF